MTIFCATSSFQFGVFRAFDGLTPSPPEIATRLSMFPSLQAEVEPFPRREPSSRQLLLLQGFLRGSKTRQTDSKRRGFNQDNQEKVEAQPAEIGKLKSQIDSWVCLKMLG